MALAENPQSPRRPLLHGCAHAHAEHLGDVLLGARPERVERTGAQPGAADVHLQVVEVGPAELDAAARAVRAELDDHRSGRQLAVDQRTAPAELHLELHAVGHRDPEVAGHLRLELLGGHRRGADRR